MDPGNYIQGIVNPINIASAVVHCQAPRCDDAFRNKDSSIGTVKKGTLNLWFLPIVSPEKISTLGVNNNMPGHIHWDLEENTAVGGIIDLQHFYQGFIYKGVGEVKISYGEKKFF